MVPLFESWKDRRWSMQKKVKTLYTVEKFADCYQKGKIIYRVHEGSFEKTKDYLSPDFLKAVEIVETSKTAAFKYAKKTI
jgi:hypothetical protein